MKFISNMFNKKKDGGPKSPVDAFFLIEIKSLFTIALLRFNQGGREQYHTHAFNAFTWFLSGDLIEQDIDGSDYRYIRSLKPKFTSKEKNHRVKAERTSWVFTVRGPWSDVWEEYDEQTDETTFLTHGRKVVKFDKVV